MKLAADVGITSGAFVGCTLSVDGFLIASALDRASRLENAVDDTNARTDDVLAALDFLERRATVKWPFDQYRNAFARERRV